MSAKPADGVPPRRVYHFDRHAPEYREQFLTITRELQQKCPIVWTDTYAGHWVAAGSQEVFELARCPNVSNDHDVRGERRGYKGISIPTMIEAENFRGGMLEMDDPEHRYYRSALNLYLSPAAVQRWEPFIDEIVRGCLDDHIEAGSIDFVDQLANVVPAVLTLAMLGVPLSKWRIYNEPAHASVYTPPDSPDQVITAGDRKSVPTPSPACTRATDYKRSCTTVLRTDEIRRSQENN
jgi:cytochrome P450